MSVWPPEVTKMAMKPSPLQKHLLDGCTVDMPVLNCHWWEGYCLAVQYIVDIIVCVCQAAHVGVGISGADGLQASCASDYSIAQVSTLHLHPFSRSDLLISARCHLWGFWSGKRDTKLWHLCLIKAHRFVQHCIYDTHWFAR